MRKLVMLGVSAALATASFVTPAAAADQACGAIVAGAVFYVAHDANGSINLWLYQETNNLGGLQRGGNTLLLNEADTCQEGALNHDQGIF